MQIFYAQNPTVGTGHTFTYTSTAKYPSITVTAWSGTATTSVFDVENGATATSGTSIATGSVTPTQNDELLIAGLTLQATNTPSIDLSFTITDTVQFSANHFLGSHAYKIQTTAAAQNPTWSWGTSTNIVAAIATFKAAVAAITISPSGRASTLALGSATVINTQIVSPGGLASGTAIGAPTLIYNQTVSPSSIASGTAIGATVVSQGLTISPTGIASTLVIGASTLVYNQTISPASISSTLAIGTPSVTNALAYTDWIKRSNRVNWFGLEGRVRREFSGWTLHSGSVWKVSWPPAGQTFAVSSMYQNGVALTQGSSAVLSAGQWWQDRTVKPNVVYVRMSDSSNPYSKTVIGHFTVRLASSVPVGKSTNDLNGVPWRPCISRQSIPSISHTLGNVFFGTAVFGTIRVTCTNADGWFDAYYDDWLWKDSEFDFLHGDGGVELSYAQHRLTNFTCSSVRISDDTFELILESPLHTLNAPVLQSIFDKATYPNMDENLQGKWIPKLFGEAEIPFYPIDMQNGKFKGVDHALDSISRVRLDGDDVSYTPDLANGEITLNTIVTGVTLAAKAEGYLGLLTYYVRVAALVRGEHKED